MISANDEKQRIHSLLFSCNVSEKKISLLEPVIENVSWMRAKLDETREQIRNTSVVIPHETNGQKTLKENPLFKGYESLFKSYMQGMQKILEIMPDEEEKAEEEEKAKTILQLVRAKHA